MSKWSIAHLMGPPKKNEEKPCSLCGRVLDDDRRYPDILIREGSFVGSCEDKYLLHGDCFVEAMRAYLTWPFAVRHACEEEGQQYGTQ